MIELYNADAYHRRAVGMYIICINTNMEKEMKRGEETYLKNEMGRNEFHIKLKLMSKRRI
jgi:hypothetical protein